jgi:hypothetical protein
MSSATTLKVPTATPATTPAPAAAPAAALSVAMTVVLVFITHGFVNALLLTPWNPLRCAYWNIVGCTEDQAWMLNWLAFSQFHMHVLLLCIARTSIGNVILEQRLVYLSSSIMLANLSTGVFMLDLLNPQMAGLQMLIYLGLLSVMLYNAATTLPMIAPLPIKLRSSSFDARKKLPVATIAVGVQFLFSALRVVDMTFGSGRAGYLGDSSSPVYMSMSHAAVTAMMWTSVILAWATLMTTAEQHKALLVGHALVLFASQIMLAGSQGERIKPDQVKVGVVGSFIGIVVSLLGAY